MKQKTAMMHLIEELRMLAFSKNHLGLGDIRLTQGYIDEIEEHYLKKEKQQIVNSYDYQRCIGDCEDGEQYYNQTYKQD